MFGASKEEFLKDCFPKKSEMFCRVHHNQNAFGIANGAILILKQPNIVASKTALFQKLKTF